MAQFTGVAFDNPMNRCYCNSSCNALLSSEIIASTVYPGHCISCDFLYAKRHATQGIHSSQELKNWVASTHSVFDNNDQNDPGEFIQALIEKCSVLNDLTKAKVHIELTCDCGNVSGNEQAKNIFYEDITSNSFSEIIGGTERFCNRVEKYCDSCKRNVYHQAKETLLIMPRVLIVVLKRFKKSKSGRPIDKILTPVEPTDIHCFNDDVIFANKAIILHHGRHEHEGHVTTFLNMGSYWIECDDENLKSSRISPVLGYAFIFDKVHDIIPVPPSTPTSVSDRNLDDSTANSPNNPNKRQHPSYTSSEMSLDEDIIIISDPKLTRSQKQPKVNEPEVDETIDTSSNNETISCRGPCKKIFPKDVFLKHLGQAKKCKAMYTDDEYSDMKKEATKATNAKHFIKQKKRKQDSLSSSSNDSLILCKGPCKLNYPRNSILRHIKKVKLCLLSYSDSDIKAMEKESTEIRYIRNAKRQRMTKSESNDDKLPDNKPIFCRKCRIEFYTSQFLSHIRKNESTCRAFYTTEEIESLKRILDFRRDNKFGPIFPCVCCHRDLENRGVNLLKENGPLEIKLKENGTFFKCLTDFNPLVHGNTNSLDSFEIDNSLRVHGHFHICHSCLDYLKKGDMPPICWKNSLDYGDIPKSLDLTNIEKQFIVKSLIFIKVRKLPTTRMDCMNDRVINVPLSDEDIIKEVSKLPRTIDNHGMVTVKLKRKKEMKNYHKMGLVRPEKIYEALRYLKENHPEYHNIEITDLDEWAKQIFDESDNDEEESDSDNCEDPEEDSAENLFNSVTCLLPEEPLNNLVVNTSDEVIKKKPSRNSNIVHEFAPGENHVATNWITQENYDIVGFPELFDNGSGGLHDKNRLKVITPKQNYNQKIFNHNKKFGNDPEFIFVAQQHIERNSFEKNISISAQRGKKVVSSDGTKTIKRDDAFDVFRKIAGTPAYWRQYRYETLARMEQMGPFTFFFTLSSNEMGWPEVLTSILHNMNMKISYEVGWEDDESKIIITDTDKGETLPLPEYRKKWIEGNKSKYYKDQFLLITRMFNSRVKAFIRLLKSCGKFDSHSYRIEFQIRGMPHVHGVLWLSQNELKKVLDENNEYKIDKVPELIDKWISCSLDNENEELNSLVAKVNTHHHTKSCNKGKTKCRFHFPRLPSEKTLIARPISEKYTDEEECKRKSSEFKDVLERVKEHLENLTDEHIENVLQNSLDKFLQELNINKNLYEEALEFSERGKVVVLKRTLKERYTNNYNPEWMLAWRGNLDIQFCLDGYAVVTYITDYLSKSDAGVTNALKNALNEVKDCNDFERLNHLKRTYITHRQVSVAEAIYRLGNRSLTLTDSSVDTLFVGAGFFENRYDQFHKVKDQNDGDSDSDSNSESDPDSGDENMNKRKKDKFKDFHGTFNIEGRKGKFKVANTIHQKYAGRPSQLENVCLAQFATSYLLHTGKIHEKIVFENGVSVQEGLIEEFGTSKKLPKFIKLSYGGTMRLRDSPIVLRRHDPKKQKGVDEDKYSELLLFSPWRSETVLRQNIRETFNANYNIIERNKKSIYPNSSMIAEIRDLIGNPEEARPMHLSDLDPTGEQENLDEEEQLEPLDTTELPNDEEHIPRNYKSDGPLFQPAVVDADEVMLEMARSLSFEQRIVFDRVVDYNKSVLRRSKGAHVLLNPPKFIVTGGGGVGKSYLIRAVTKWTEKILQKAGPIKPKALLLAFTGVAASLIGGTTFHSGIGFSWGNDQSIYNKQKMDKIKNELEEVQVTIVDEMSMVSADHLYHLDKRLKIIFESQNDDFGGRATLLVGDLLQLPPVKAKPIFSRPKDSKFGHLYDARDEEGNPVGNLWLNLEVVILRQNYRQGEGDPWTDLLNRLRIGELTPEDIEVLQFWRRHVNLSENDYNNAIHLFYSNIEVFNHNLARLNALEGELFEIEARIEVPRRSRYNPTVNDYGLIGDSSFSMNLQFKIGARIMLIYNVNIPDHLVNGCIGYIVDILRNQLGQVYCVVVEFDDPKVGLQQIRENKHIADRYPGKRACPIFKETMEKQITCRKTKTSTHGASYKITQLPLRLAWGSTGHKVQGLTIKAGTNVVAHGNSIMPPGLYYVMLSRAERRENVYTENFLPQKCKPNALALAENQMLEERDIAPSYESMHFSFYVANIRGLKKHMPDISHDMFAQRSDHICLVETSLEPPNTHYLVFDWFCSTYGRSFSHASVRKGQGCAIFSKTSRHEGKESCVDEKIINENFTIMSMTDGPFQLILIYLSKNCEMENVANNLKKLIKSTKIPIIAGDVNFDKTEENILTRFLTVEGFEQLITSPTHDEGRTIDHCYVPAERKKEFKITLHSLYFSDHDAICINLSLEEPIPSDD